MSHHGTRRPLRDLLEGGDPELTQQFDPHLSLRFFRTWTGLLFFTKIWKT